MKPIARLISTWFYSGYAPVGPGTAGSLAAVAIAWVLHTYAGVPARGFAVMAVTGALLFYAIPVKTYLNIFFRIKVAFLVLAGVNVAVFQRTVWRSIDRWDIDSVPPLRARLAAGVSLVLWAGIVVAGRMIAYNWFDKNVSALFFHVV